MAHTITQRCPICAKNYPKHERHPPNPGIQYKEEFPFEDSQIDFTQVPRTTRNFKYLLVFVDTFLEWIEAFPIQTEKSSNIVRLLLKEIVLRFSLPYTTWNDNANAFVPNVVQKVSATL